MKYRVCICGWLLLLCCVHGIWAEESASPGERRYQVHCASCHGAKLQGGNAQSLIDGVWQFGAGQGYAFRNIKFGIPHLGMPSYEASLSDEDIRTILAFLQEAETQAGAGAPELPSVLETQDYFLSVDILATHLQTPWGLAFLDPNQILVTERPGRLRLIRQGTMNPLPIANTPEVLNEGQGGLLDVAVDPDYTNNHWVYLSYSHALSSPSQQGRVPAMTRIVRGRIKDHQWTDQQVLFEAPHTTYRTTRHHYGSRIVFDQQGYLYFSIGDRGAGDQAQQLDHPNGKIHRILPDGRIPPDNPFAQTAQALPSLFSVGHRNPQGMAVHAQTDHLWISEHGPMGGDELNLITRGANYGWPEITSGETITAR